MDKEEQDRLIRVETKLDILIKHFDNHLKHHWSIIMALLTITGGVIVALIINML